jgi:hypothetical protein
MKSRLCAVVSDIHFPHQHQAGWESFVQWCADWRPAHVVVNGDALDFESLSRFQKTPDNVSAIAEIRVFVRELHRLVGLVGLVEVQEGNHDERWGHIVAAHAVHLGGAIGLTLEEQCRFQGLDRRVKWTREDVLTLGTRVGPFRVRHGHKQSRGFGPKHIAAGRLDKTLGDSEIVGHHHRAQLYCRAAFGKQAVAIANPSMTAPHNYAPGADWQTGFTVVECFGDDATAYPVVMTLDGRFAWGGRVYGLADSAGAAGDDGPDGVGRDAPAVSAPVQPAAVSASNGHVSKVDISQSSGTQVSCNFAGCTVCALETSAGGLDYDDVADTQIGPPRVAAPQSRRAFAESVGVPESTLRDWERREGKPWWQYAKEAT